LADDLPAKTPQKTSFFVLDELSSPRKYSRE